MIPLALLFAVSNGSAAEKPEADAPVAGARWPEGRVLTALTEHERKIHAALEQPFEYAADGITLEDFAKRLEERLKCAVVLDLAALTADGIQPNHKLSPRCIGRSLRVELRKVLASIRSTFVVVDDCLLITTKTAAEFYPEVRVYQVHDLVVEADDPNIAHPKLEDLAYAVRVQVEPQEWDYGQRSIHPFEGPGILALLVSQTVDIHEKVEDLLKNLRLAKRDDLHAAQQQLDPAMTVARRTRYNEKPRLPPPAMLSAAQQRGKTFTARTAADRRVDESLRLPAKFDFTETPLKKIAAELEAKHKLTVEFDVEALTADGVGLDTELSLRWPSGSLRGALRTLTRSRGIDYVIRDGAILITTRSAAEFIEETMVYQVHDLLAQDLALAGFRSDFETLENLLPSVIHPGGWREGSGTVPHVTGFEAAGLRVLVIFQSQEIHEEIQRLLELLRSAYEPKVYEAQRRRPIVVAPPTEAPAVKGMGGGF